MVFPSKRDGWITISILGSSAMLLFAAGLVLVRGGPIERIVLPLFCAIVIAFSVSLLTHTRYIVADDELVIRCGVLRWRVDIGSITRIAPTGDISSSPALSLDRIRIDYTKNGQPDVILVSPADKDGFIAALRARNPAITLPA